MPIRVISKDVSIETWDCYQAFPLLQVGVDYKCSRVFLGPDLPRLMEKIVTTKRLPENKGLHSLPVSYGMRQLLRRNMVTRTMQSRCYVSDYYSTHKGPMEPITLVKSPTVEIQLVFCCPAHTCLWIIKQYHPEPSFNQLLGVRIYGEVEGILVNTDLLYQVTNYSTFDTYTFKNFWHSIAGEVAVQLPQGGKMYGISQKDVSQILRTPTGPGWDPSVLPWVSTKVYR